MGEEAKLQKKIIDKLIKKGWYVLNLIKTNKNGIPDLLALKDGEKPFFIEVKAKNGKASKLQEFRIKELNGLGFKAIITKSLEL
jgi:Holliday junction resolvase